MPVPVSDIKTLLGGEDHFAKFKAKAEEGQTYTLEEVRQSCGIGESGLKRSMRTHADLDDWRIRVAKGYRYATPKTIKQVRKVLNA